jgi:hypothetical protein
MVFEKTSDVGVGRNEAAALLDGEGGQAFGGPVAFPAIQVHLHRSLDDLRDVAILDRGRDAESAPYGIGKKDGHLVSGLPPASGLR